MRHSILRARAFTLTLLHTANTDSQVLAVGSFNGPCDPTNITTGNSSYVTDPATSPCIGGVARRAALIKSIRASLENSLLIDAGHLFTGSVFWTLFGAEMLGGYYNEMGYDAIKLDLFEFFGGVDQLAKFIELVPNTRIVAANLVGKNDSRLANVTIVPYVIFTFANGDKVGFAGTLVAQVGTRFENSRSINSFDELTGMLQAVGSMLNQGVNKIIASVSDANVLDSIINSVPGIDIVIVPNLLYANDEGTHEVIQGTYPQIRYMAWEGSHGTSQQPVLLVASGEFGRRLGRLDVEFDEFGVLTSWNGNAIQLDGSVDADLGIQQQILSQMDQVRASANKVVGRAAVDIEWQDSCVFGECAIGNWVAEVFRNTTGTQIGVVNGGAVYGPFRQGGITLGEYLVVFPFGWDFLFTLKIKGENLIAVLDNSVSLADRTDLPLNAGTGRFLSVAGLRFTWNPSLPVGQRVVDVWVQRSDGGWAILDHQQYYSLTTLDFVAQGGDSYEILAETALDADSTQMTASTALEASLAKSLVRPIDVVIDGRIAESNGTRMTCIAPDGRICSDNGYCESGVCHCTVRNTAGPYCIVGAKNNSTGGSDVTGIVIGTVVPVVSVLVFVLLAALVLCAFLIFRVTRRRKEEWDVNFDELEIGNLLGEGSFGEVYKGLWKGTEVAVKVMTPGLVSREMQHSFVAEMRVMSALRHPNVVLFMGASSKPPRQCIIMEYMALGSLYDVLHNDLVRSIPMTLSLKIALRAAKGMHFLHSSGIVHRDLKSLNLLLDSKWNVKVSDFGMGQFKDRIKANDGHVGSIPWTAPEVLAEQPDVDYASADCYSFGVVLFEIASRRDPYEHLSAAAIAVGVLRDDIRPTTHADATLEATLQEAPEAYLVLMRNCWDTDPAMRPTFLEIMTRLEALVHESPAVSCSASGPLDSTTSFLPPRAAGDDSEAEDGEELSEVEPDRPQLGPVGTRPPRGWMVIGFTDIANADVLWERNAAAMRDATLLHNQILRALLKKHSGYEAVLADTHGEGSFCVAFQRAASALAWASDVQRALLQADWPPELLKCVEAGEEWGDVDDRLLFRGPRVRMGFHFGRPRATTEPRYRATCFAGAVVRCAAAVAMLAEGGQVLVSDAFRRSLANAHEAAASRLRPVVGRKLEALISACGDDDEGRREILRVFEWQVEGLEARLFACDALGRASGADPMVPSTPSTDSPLSSRRLSMDSSRRGSATCERDEAIAARGDGREDELHTCALNPNEISTTTTNDNTSASSGSLGGPVDGTPVYLTSANLCRWIIRYEDLTVGEQVGTGSYGLVHVAKWRGVEVAVKRLIKQRLTEQRLLEFRAEVALLAELHHPNIVLFIGACVRSPNLCVVMELVKRGSLRAILSDVTIKLPWRQRLRMLHGAALAVTYLHSLKPVILHRDLKSSNLLVDEAWTVKVADFGFARIKEENATMTRCGTPCWTAPEIIAGHQYSEKADVYSFGIVMWEVLTRKVPYAGQTFMSVALEVLDNKRPEVPSHCPPAFERLMRLCWHAEEAKRPLMEDVAANLEAMIVGRDGGEGGAADHV